MRQVQDPDDPKRKRWIAQEKGGKPVRWRARTKYRDADGKLRDVERYGPTKGSAEGALKAALADRKAPVSSRDGLRPTTTVRDAGAYWLQTIERPGVDLSPRTVDQYRGTYERCIKSSNIAELTLVEANRVVVLEGFLQDVADRHGIGTARSVRSVLSLILRLAVRHEVIEGSRLRDVRMPTAGKVRQTERDPDRAFTEVELTHVLAVARAHEEAQRLDVVDLLHFMAGTGVRVSEGLGVRWDDLRLSGDDGEALTVGVAHVRGTKTDHADRMVPLADWLTHRLRERARRLGTGGYAFQSPATRDPSKPRDLRNVERVVRKVLDAAGCPWATSHTFRTTVGHMVTVSQGATAAANVLGHSSVSMTYDFYSQRRGPAEGAALTLAGLLPVVESGGLTGDETPVEKVASL